MTLADVDAYFEDIDPNTFEYWCAQDEPPTVSKVEEFFDGIEFSVPQEFSDFTTSRLSGLHFVVREEVWPRKKGGAHWWFLYGISVFGLGPELPEWLDLTAEYEKFRTQGLPDLLPFMRVVSDADPYCFTRDGRIVRWYHETNETKSIELSFSDCLLQELHALEQRKDRVVRSGLT